ncbi:MAG: DNA-3-methyladenine glycosylase 2 family protein [Gammaproteobacteria bacterium]|nr:DNA-3-methyladenine glycosylase 2 family protein [Gammaproteobacteria bacterium]
MDLSYDAQRAVVTLRRSDEQLAALMRRVGRFALVPRSNMTPFHELLRAIIYQQLSGKAASAIYKRILKLLGARKPSPRAILELSTEELRVAGLSRSKIISVKDLAHKTIEGMVPGKRRLQKMEDKEIVAKLVAVRGVGQWTAEMLLIFNLGRPDVLPVSDLGVRKGFMLAYQTGVMPTEAELQQYGERWRPYRSVASWYLWRANDLEY